MSGEPSVELLERYRRGDERAAAEIYGRYAKQLSHLARERLAGKLSRRLDPEDVVQSAYRSFFTRFREGGYTLRRSGDLWRLLVGILRNKLLGQVERHTAERRSVQRESAFDQHGVPAAAIDPLSTEPSAEDAVLAAELLAWIMTDLTTAQRQVLELRLQNSTLDEIAAETGRSERTVRRWLEEVKTRLSRHLATGNSGDGAHDRVR